MKDRKSTMLRDDFLHAISAMAGEECWGVACGEGTGSVIALHIGARTIRAKPLRNPHASYLIRRYDGAYSLLLWCSWRIDSDLDVVAGSHMVNTNDGPMVVGSNAICGQRITSATCSGPAFDLRLEFENRHTLVVHCSAVGKDYEECYVVRTPFGHYTVSLDGQLSFAASG